MNAHSSILDNIDPQQNKKNHRSVYLEGIHNLHSKLNLRQVAPIGALPVKAFLEKDSQSDLYDMLKPLLLFLRAIGIYPIQRTDHRFQVTVQMLVYSVVVIVLILGFIGYIKWDKVEMVRTAEGRFEEAVIDYLFTVYLLPIVTNFVMLYEAKKQAKVLTDLLFFEKLYNRITGKKIDLFMGNKPMMMSIAIPILSCAIMIVTHVTMVHFRLLQVIPYCYINTITFMVGAFWALYCDMVGKIALKIAENFDSALKHVGPSTNIAEYRSLWMMLSKIIRDIGHAFGYTMTFLCLYLFLVITLTVYGLLSQIQEGLGVKDIGLTIAAVFSSGLLFFVCDQAHYASNCVRVQFQKKLLLVELSWMNEDAQQEINMFLRATEMSPTDMSLGGFFDVNKNLFKSLLATMVTYLVVLLQFQISIPEDSSLDANLTIFTTTMKPV